MSTLLDPLEASHSILSEKIQYSCVMGFLPERLSQGVFSLYNQIKPQDLKDQSFEDGSIPPHVTVFYGLHTNNPSDVLDQLKQNRSVRPATVKLGPLSLFRSRDQDILKLSVESPDLRHLNSVIRKMPSSPTFSEYNPHVTVGVLRPGRGEGYLRLPNPIQGESTTFSGLAFSTPDKKVSHIPLGRPSIADISELVLQGFNTSDVVEMTTAMSVGSVPRGMNTVRPIFPSMYLKRSKSPTTRKVNENEDDSFNFADIPLHTRVSDELEGGGWEHVETRGTTRVFRHEDHPKSEVLVNETDPVWTVKSKGGVVSQGSLVPQLRSALSRFGEHYDSF